MMAHAIKITAAAVLVALVSQQALACEVAPVPAPYPEWRIADLPPEVQTRLRANREAE